MLWREMLQIIKNKEVNFLLLLGPILLTILFGGIYVNSAVNDIPIAVLDEDQSSVSTSITQQFDENERFDITQRVDNQVQLKALLDNKKVMMAVCIPPDFAKNLQTLHAPEVLLMTDGTNMIISNSVYATAAGIIQTVAAGAQIKLLEGKGMLPQVAKHVAMPFVFQDRILYDPRLQYMNYLLLGYIAVFLQQVMLAGVGNVMIQASEQAKRAITLQAIACKVVACTIFALLSTTVAMGIAAFGFHVPIRGNVLVAVGFCALFAFAMSAPAILLAALIGNKTKFAQIAYMVSLPAFVSCGYVWPLDQMPPLLVGAIKIVWPLASFARPFDEFLIKGMSVWTLLGSGAELLVYTLVWLPIGVWVYNRKLRTT
ncbi:MAG: ABC transporter permease [Hyphomonadaceae bacterium]|nr:ABC transporter permease [Clostridia bacterium]